MVSYPLQDIAPDTPVNPPAAPTLIDGEDVAADVQLLLSGDVAKEEQLRNKVLTNTLTDNLLREYLERIGIKSVREKWKNIEKLIKWLDESPQWRPFVLLAKAKLIDACINKFGGKKSHCEGSDSETLMQRLSTYQNDPSYIVRMANPQPEGFSFLQTSLLRMIVKSSFLPRLTAKGKEFCKLGHELEIPFAKKLIEHSNAELTLFKVEKIFCMGLVAKQDELYVKASCDFVTCAVVEGERQLVGVECKAQVTPGTYQRERIHAEFLSQFHSMSISSSSPTTSTTTRGAEM
jgi:hypothetical protein